MNWLRRFMAGRYGGDQLSMALLIFSVILSFTAGLTDIPLITLFSYVPFGIAVFRMLSKDTAKRSLENYKFSRLMNPVYSWLIITRDRMRDIKTHRYFTCPKCGQSLRVPRGKGKIVVICRRCKTEFKGKT